MRKIDRLLALATEVEAAVKKLGYDRVDSVELHCVPWAAEVGIEDRVSIFCMDDFQKNLPHATQVQHGTLYFYLEEGEAELRKTLAALYTREQRELHVLARQTGETKAMTAELQSSAGRAFALKILETREELSRMIEHKQDGAPF